MVPFQTVKIFVVFVQSVRRLLLISGYLAVILWACKFVITVSV